MLDQFSRQRFDIIRATQWIDDLSNAALLGQHNLCIAGNARRKVGRQRYGFIQRIGVQRLRPTQGRGHRLNRRANDVVIGVLLLQRHARRLAMRAQHFGAFVLRAQIIHDAVPQGPRGA